MEFSLLEKFSKELKYQRTLDELSFTVYFVLLIMHKININIDNGIDCREIFDNAIQFKYGGPLEEYSEKSINAIMVNDIRHNYSNYDQMLKSVYRVHRCDNDYIQYKNSVLDKISIAYPFLKDECIKQKHKNDMVKICKR